MKQCQEEDSIRQSLILTRTSRWSTRSQCAKLEAVKEKLLRTLLLGQRMRKSLFQRLELVQSSHSYHAMWSREWEGLARMIIIKKLRKEVPQKWMNSTSWTRRTFLHRRRVFFEESLQEMQLRVEATLFRTPVESVLQSSCSWVWSHSWKFTPAASNFHEKEFYYSQV